MPRPEQGQELEQRPLLVFRQEVERASRSPSSKPSKRRGAEAYEREVRKLLASGSWKEGERKQTPTLEGFAEELVRVFW